MFRGLGHDGRRLDDTWTWTGADWREQRAARSPPARADHALAFDPTRRRHVLFGGGSAPAGGRNDTWEWDGTTWRELQPDLRPAPRRGHAMCYDPTRGATLLFGYDTGRHTVVVFGGRGNSTRLRDLWEWDGTMWHDRTPDSVLTPAARTGATMIYDPRRRRVVLFGGEGDLGVLNDTWEWDGTAWSALSLSSVPSGRHHHGMAYDPARATAIVFAGDDGTPLGLRDTWFLRHVDPADPQ